MCSATPDLTVTFPAAGHRRPVTGSKLYCMVTEARAFQLARGRYLQGRRSPWDRGDLSAQYL